MLARCGLQTSCSGYSHYSQGCQPRVLFLESRLKSTRFIGGSKVGFLPKPLSGSRLRQIIVVPQNPLSASSAGRSHSDVRFGDDSSEEPYWLSITKECVGAIITSFSFLAEQPRQLRFIEWPTFSSTFKTATLTLVLVALLIVALATVDAGLCYMLAMFLRKKSL